MNGFVGWVFLALAWFSYFNVITFSHDKTAFQLAFIVLSAVFFLRQEFKELRDIVNQRYIDDKRDEGDRPNGFTPRQS